MVNQQSQQKSPHDIHGAAVWKHVSVIMYRCDLNVKMVGDGTSAASNDLGLWGDRPGMKTQEMMWRWDTVN